LVAARRAPGTIGAAIEYLENNEGDIDSVGERAKAVTALVATGADPRAFAGRNLVAEMKDSEEPDGQYGVGTQVFDHASAMLAIVAAGGRPSLDAVNWLLDARCDDGGWEFAEPAGSQDEHCDDGSGTDYSPSDTNTTSVAVQAIRASHRPVAFDFPVSFFKDTRDDEKGGWGYTSGNVTDANSTALVIQTFVDAGRRLPAGSKRALRRLQIPPCSAGGGGAFAYNWEDSDENGSHDQRGGANLIGTIGAVLGLLERPLPIESANVTKPYPKPKCP
jgi:hypothetical protein